MQHDSCTFCMHPFTGLATREDGAIKLCCRSQPIGWIQNESLESAWNNNAMRKVREQILNSKRPDVCKPCFDLEDQGVQSLRQRHIKNVIPESRINLYPNALTNLNDDYTMPFELPTIEIKINNLCNLKCRMCNPLDSTSWKDWKEVENFYQKENNYLVPAINNLVKKPGQYIGPFDNSKNWWNSFEKLLPFLRRVEFAGGEPLMDPYHYRILDMLTPYGNNIELKYATNGTVLGIKGERTIYDYWPKFKSIAVNVSIDGIHDVYEYIRGNGKFKTVEDNIKIFKTFTNVSRVVGAFTVQANNIMQIDQVIKYFLTELEIVFYSHRVSYPRALSAQTLPQPLKDLAIKRLQKINIDFKNYSIVKKNPILVSITEQQIIDNINFLKSTDLSKHWQDCINFNQALDRTRSQNFLEINPEFLPYIKFKDQL
jgi:MoaA/NifB/PqqE/SkfB family radical SAM enzyme